MCHCDAIVYVLGSQGPRGLQGFCGMALKIMVLIVFDSFIHMIMNPTYWQRQVH